MPTLLLPSLPNLKRHILTTSTVKAIKASYTAGGKWSGAPQGLNESHEACMRQPYAGNVKSMCDPHYVLYIEQLPTKEAREATTAIRRL